MKLVIVGVSKFSQMLKDYITDLDVDVLAYTVDEKYIKVKDIDGIPVVSMDKLDSYYSNNDVELVLGIGYSRLGNVKKEMYNRCKKMGYSFYNYVHPSAIIDKSVEMGEGNLIFENVVIQKYSRIGSGNLFFSNSVIMHDNQIGNYNTFGACSVSNGFVQVNDCCFIGANATLRDGIAIGENNLVGAGTYVNRSTDINTGVLTAKPFYKNGGGIYLSEKL